MAGRPAGRQSLVPVAEIMMHNEIVAEVKRLTELALEMQTLELTIAWFAR